MFPGFVYMYKDDESYVHLYFFAGFSEEGKQIYKNIDLKSVPFDYELILDSEFAKDYKFLNKTIIKIKCELVENGTDKIENKILSL